MDKSILTRLDFESYGVLYELPIEKLLSEIKLRVWLYAQDYFDCKKPDLLEETAAHFERFWAERFVKGNIMGHTFGEDLHQAHLPYVYCDRDHVEPSLPVTSRKSVKVPSMLETIDWVNALGKVMKDNFYAHSKEAGIESAEKEYLMFMKGPAYRLHEIFVTVDFLQPKSLILRDMERIIDQVKSHDLTYSLIGSSWRDDKRQKMRNYRVFEQVDSIIVARAFSINLSNEKLAEIIFKNNPDMDPDNFRRTQHKFMKRIFSQRGYRELSSL
ncbi:hypothetical protein CWE08_07475 [Aliidiomarina iranensis]|uniref:Uncharacterized protein n=1 Tax=Aliidiomarina iranensis TaxID=1434071 RepID=A0A432VWG7_9GAMM|nr:DUF6387 family protein [Aliidiomarina iranensis]RUO20932.1 hypothetical protein CWE08_07475 [Aliidiomarina iranensis]